MLRLEVDSAHGQRAGRLILLLSGAGRTNRNLFKASGIARGGTATSGTFMQMNASDGPHYGANVKLDKAGTYQLKLSIESPAAKGWMLHVDPETGVKNHQFWTEPIEVTFDNWDYTPRQW